MINMSLSSPWIKGEGQTQNIVLATRIRLARNIINRPMPQKLDAEQGGQVLNQCLEVLNQIQNPKFNIYKMEELSPLERGVLVEKHMISPAFMEPSPYAAAAISEDESVCVMINEEDHLRIQCLLSGLQLEEAWRSASYIDDMLEQKISYAFDAKLGYLTACLTNIGTGLRASVMVHLPALSITGRAAMLFANLARMGMTVRGIYGEGSESSGDVFQISNQVTLGLSEQEIIDALQTVILQIVEEEKTARAALKQQNELDLTDSVWRAYAILVYSRKISINEMMNRLSYLRLGVDMGIIKDISPAYLTELMIRGQTAYIQQTTKQPLTEQEGIDCERATMLREALGGHK